MINEIFIIFTAENIFSTIEFDFLIFETFVVNILTLIKNKFKILHELEYQHR